MRAVVDRAEPPILVFLARLRGPRSVRPPAAADGAGAPTGTRAATGCGRAPQDPGKAVSPCPAINRMLAARRWSRGGFEGRRHRGGGGPCVRRREHRTDNGDGVAAEHVPRLTERFYRVDKGRSRASGGTGLGLAIVKHVLNRHDAQLVIESELGQGSAFTCRFPSDTGLYRPQSLPRGHSLGRSH